MMSVQPWTKKQQARLALVRRTHFVRAAVSLLNVVSNGGMFAWVEITEQYPSNQRIRTYEYIFGLVVGRRNVPGL